jgi:signal transduction histidine kinase
MSRIASGKVAMELQAAQPHQMILNAVESYRAAARQRGVELKTDMQDDLPDVLADTIQIAHVFANLLFNAMKYTGSGGMITLSALADEEQVRFSVSDTGEGIPEEYLPKIFDRFFRVPGQEHETGTGLGLSIVKEIVEAHGGSVGVDSHVGEGTTFSFTLPTAGTAAKDEARHD